MTNYFLTYLIFCMSDWFSTRRFHILLTGVNLPAYIFKQALLSNLLFEESQTQHSSLPYAISYFSKGGEKKERKKNKKMRYWGDTSSEPLFSWDRKVKPRDSAMLMLWPLTKVNIICKAKAASDFSCFILPAFNVFGRGRHHIQLQLLFITVPSTEQWEIA